MIITMHFLSFTVSSLSSVITMIDFKKKMLDIKLAMIDEYAKESGISKLTKQKMQNRIRIINERLPLSLEEEEKLMREIPKDLKFEIACNIFDGSLCRFLFFKDRDKEFLTSIALFLQPHYFSKRDSIITKGEVATEIYFVLHGSVNYINGEEETVFQVFREGQNFADIEVLLKIKRLFNVNAACEATLLVMKENYVKKIKDDFPGIWKEMKVVAKEKLEKMNKSLAEALVLKTIKRNEEIKHIKSKSYKEMINYELEKIHSRNKVREKKIFKSEKSFDNELSEQIQENYNAILAISESLNELDLKVRSLVSKKE